VASSVLRQRAPFPRPRAHDDWTCAPVFSLGSTIIKNPHTRALQPSHKLRRRRVHRFHILSKLVQQNKTHEIQCVVESNTTRDRDAAAHFSMIEGQLAWVDRAGRDSTSVLRPRCVGIIGAVGTKQAHNCAYAYSPRMTTSWWWAGSSDAARAPARHEIRRIRGMFVDCIQTFWCCADADCKLPLSIDGG
jgi:hypothetical protein